jgi:hypothetical protein
MMMCYVLLFVFVSLCSILITTPLYAMTHHTWVSCFILAVILTLFTLENVSLLNEISQKKRWD